MDRDEETQESKNERYINNAELIFIFIFGYILGIGLFLLLLKLYL